MRVQGGLKVRPELILGVVFLKRVALGSDAVLVFGELFAFGLISEHDADYQHLLRQFEGRFQRGFPFFAIFYDVQHKAEIDDVCGLARGIGPKYRVPPGRGNVHELEQAEIVAQAAAVVEERMPTIEEAAFLHFEVDDEDEPWDRAAADGLNDRVLRKRGKSKNGGDDAPQLVVGLAVTRDGLPVCHWIFPGNTVDVSTVEQVKRDLKGWRLGRCVFVGDAGMVSKDNLKKLALGGGRYIVCMPVHAGGEVDTDVVSRPGRYRPVAENLKVKEVVVGDGERRRRYVVCHNPSEAERKRRHRAVVLDELATEVKSLREDNEPGHSKRVCALRASARYGRYVRLTRTGLPKIDRAKIKAAERLDGKFVVHGNDDTLSAEDLALGYKQLQRVEEAWRRLKSGLKLRPVYHFAPQRIRAHVALSVLALLLERVAERACGDTWRNIRDDVKRIKLAQLSSPEGELWQVTDPGPDAAKRLKSLQIPHPPPILRLA